MWSRYVPDQAHTRARAHALTDRGGERGREIERDIRRNRERAGAREKIRKRDIPTVQPDT
jgi:hypothetical protein